ncbi:MAG: EAL domain-containing protein, partial [Cyanobacteria bacterium J06639_1]
GTISGVEALLRIDRAEMGVLEPRDFLTLASNSGLMRDFGTWVLLTACGQAKIWRDAGIPLSVAVNVSRREFGESDLPGSIRSVLDATGLPAAQLELDLTESLLVEDPDRALLLLYELHEIGVRLVLDDFGTGYSSLHYLQRFPLHALKIDMRFIQGLPNNTDDDAIVRAALAIGAAMNYQTIAEGVETEAQLDILQQHGCDRVQGYLIGRPVDADLLLDEYAPIFKFVRS